MSTVIDGSNSVTINSGAVLGITSGTAVASTSGTSIDFTGIPSWVKRITVMFNGVSTNGTSIAQIQLGSASVTTTGYDSRVFNWTGGTAGASASSGFVLETTTSATAASVRVGLITICLLTGNTWVAGGTVSSVSTNGNSNVIQGSIALSGALDRVRITTVNGTDAFDAGSINILYE